LIYFLKNYEPNCIASMMLLLRRTLVLKSVMQKAKRSTQFIRVRL